MYGFEYHRHKRHLTQVELAKQAGLFEVCIRFYDQKTKRLIRRLRTWYLMDEGDCHELNYFQALSAAATLSRNSSVKMNCTPQYEYCITQCKYFVPDERYVPMAKQLYDEYGKRLKNFTGNSTDIEFLKSQQNIWRIFLERAKDSGNKEIQNE